METGRALANPTGGSVAAGSASILQPNPSSLTVLQQSNYAVINWQSFDIGAGETTRFVQPSSSAFVLNRVTGGDPSLIAGQLLANGGIAIVNGAGILFLKGSTVDVNSLVATTADISNANFMAGRFNFDRPSAHAGATVVNNGHITVKDHGLAALVAPGVANSGEIEAKLGTVVMGGAQTFTVDLYGDGLINFAVGSGSPQAKSAPTSVSNDGRISADGGTILLTADAVDSIVSNLVTGGTLDAHSVGAKTGTVEIEGGTVQVGGRVSVSGDRAGETGGTVEATGTDVSIASGASIDASGSAGGGTVRIASTSVSNPAAATTTIGQGAFLSADALKSGNGGKVAILSTGTTQFDGSISARGGANSGNGGSVETSGAAITIGGTVDTTAARGTMGTWLLDPSNIVIGTTLALTIDDAGTDVAVVATGNITVSSNLAPSGSLGLEAGNSIALDANITMASNANLFLTAAAGSITQSLGAAITMDGGTLSMAAGNGIGSALAPIATIGLGTVSATAPEGGIFLANSSSGSIVVGSQSATTFTAGTSPIVVEELDDAGTMIDEESAGAGTNALVISTVDSPVTTVAFSAVSGLFTTGSISVANAAGGLTIDDAVDSSDGGSITLSAETMAIDATVESAGSLTIEPSSVFSSIGIGDGAVGSFILNAASLGHLGSGGGIGAGFAAITIGSADGIAALDVNNGVSGTLAFAAPLTLQSGASGGSIAIATPVTVFGGLALIAGGTVASTALSIGSPVEATGDIGLVATNGNIALSAILVGANVYLSATGGAVTETTGAVVAGSGSGDLIVAAENGSALDADSNSVGVLSADVTAGGFSFTNSGALSVGTASVNPPDMGSISQHGVTASGDVGLVASTGNLVLADNAMGANVYLSATGGAVTETTGAVVAGSGAGDLIVAAENDSALDAASNSVGVLSADVTAGGFSFANSGALSVGTASASPPDMGSISQRGVTASGDVGLVASTGNLVLADNAMGANVYLSATEGALTETTGAVVAGSGSGDLIATAETGSALNAASNSVGVLSADVTAGGFSFSNAGALSVGTASVSPPDMGSIFQHGATASGDVGLVALTGNLTLVDNVMGANVYLSATGGDVTETTGAVVSGSGAGDLLVSAENGSALDVASNSVGVLSSDVTAGGFSFTNAGGFSVGTASVSPPNLGSISQHGVTASGDAGLVASTGNLTLADNVIGANVYLSATGGAVTETTGAVVAGSGAGDLIVAAVNGSALDVASNSVGVLSSDVTAGGFSFTNAGGFSVGTASVSPPNLGSISQHGVTASGDAGLVASTGNLTLADNVIGANVYLSATGGAVTETTGAVVAGSGAGDLIVAAVNGSALDAIGNSVGVLSADVTAGGFSFTNSGGFSVGTATVSPPSIGLTSGQGVTASGGLGLVASTGNLTLADNGMGANVYLRATGGAVTETAGAVVAGSGSGDLIVAAENGSALDAASNSVGVLSADVTAGGFSFTNVGALSVGTASVSPPDMGSIFQHGATASGDLGLVASTGNLTLADNAMGVNVYLGATGGAVTETTGAVVAGSGSGDLIVAAENGSALNAATNSVGILSADVTMGGIAFTNAGALSVGTASVSPPGIGLTSGQGVIASGDIGLVTSTGNLVLAESVVGANIYLRAPAGAVTETAGAVVAGSGLGDLIVTAENGSALNIATNSVGVLSADVTAGGFAFTNAGGLLVGAASASPPGIGLTSQQGVTAGGDLGLVASTGNLTLADNVMGANVYLNSAAGAVTETIGAVIAGSGSGDLIVTAESGSALNAAMNSVGILSADVTAGGFAFTNAGGFSVATASVNPPGIGLTSAQSVTASGDVGLVASTGSLTIAQTVSGANVYLGATVGGVAETTGSVVAGSGSGDLIVVSQNDSALDATSNSIGVLSADVTAGGLAVTNAGGFSVATASVSSPGIGLTSGQGVTASGDVGLVASTGNLILADNVVGANVYLSAAGAVTETTGAVVAGMGAGSLVVSAVNDTVLDTGTNSIGVLAADIGAGGLTFTNANGFAIGSASLSIPATVATGAKAIAVSMSGVTVALGLDLDAKTGDIAQSQPLSVGTSSVIKTEAANATIGLDNPGNEMTGSVALDTAGSSGNASLTNGAAGGTNLAASSVGGNLTVVALAGNLTESGSITGGGTLALIASEGSILIDHTLQSTAGNAFLEADGAGSAIVSAGGNIALGGAGAVSLVANAGIGGSGATQFIPLADAGGSITLAAETVTGGIYVGASDPRGLALGPQATPPAGFQVIANGGAFTTDTTSGGDIAIANLAGSLVLSKAASSAAGSIYLEADGTGAAITAAGGNLEVGTGTVSLVANAGVGAANAPFRIMDGGALNLAGATSTGGWDVSASSPSATGAPITVGALTTPAFFVTSAVTGVTVASSGDVAIQSRGGTATGGSIVLANGITAAGNAFIEADGTGASIATTGGAITLGGTSLSLVANAGVGTASVPIDVSDGPSLSLAGASVTGGWYVNVSNPGAAGSGVAIGTVTPPSFFAASPVQGVTAVASGNVAIQNTGRTTFGGTISLVDDIDLSANSTGSVFLEAEGIGSSISDTGGVIRLAGGSLSLVANAEVGASNAPVLVVDGAPLTVAGATTIGGWYLSASSPAAAGAAVTIGAIPQPPFFGTTLVSGVTVASGGDVAIENAGGSVGGGAIVLSDSIVTPGSVFLEASQSGSTIVTSGGGITLGGTYLFLAAATGVGTASAPIRVVDGTALILSGAGGAAGWYVTASSPVAVGASVLIGTELAPAYFETPLLQGVTVASGGDLALQDRGGTVTGGSIVIGSSIVGSGSVFLEADGSGAQITAKGGAINVAGGGLSLVANAGIGTATAPIRVTQSAGFALAGATQTGGWYLSASSPDAAGGTVTIGTLVPPSFFASTPVVGVTVAVAGDVAIQNLGGMSGGGAIVLANNVGSAGNVFLEADGPGATITTSGGVISAASGLSLTATAGVGTPDVPISASTDGALTLAGETASGGWYVRVSSPLASGPALTIGALAPPSYFATTALDGVTAGGDVGVQNEGGTTTGGSIVLANDINAAGNVFLETTGPGSDVLTSVGTINLSGGSLSLFAAAGIGSGTEPIGISDTVPLTVAASTTTGGIYLTIADAAGVTVGQSATTPAFFLNGTTSGLQGLASTASGDVALQNSDGSVALSNNATATGSAASVFLEADGPGAAILASGGAVVLAGGTLSLVANSGVGSAAAPVPVVLGGSGLTLAGATETGGWYVTVSSPGQGGIVTLGSATPPGFFVSGPIAGVTIGSSGDFALQNLGGATSGGAIVLTNNVDLSHDSGGNAFIEADGTGSTIVNGGGTILLDGSQVALSADAGIGTATAPITTVDAGAMTVAASTQSGGIFLFDSSPTTAGAAVTVGTVVPPSFFTTSPVTGVSSPVGGNVSIVNAGGGAGGGTIDLAGPVTLNGTTGALTLTATGAISQTSGTINADKLTVTAAGAVTLPADNTIANLGLVTLTSAGDFVFQDTGKLALLNDVTVENGAIAIATTGILTVPGDITLEATGNIALGSAGFDENGMITIIDAPALMIDTSGLTAAELDAISVNGSGGVGSIPLGPGTETNPIITLAGSIDANGAALLFSVTNSLITGEVEVSQLGITGFNDSINLIGSIDGDSTPFAALLAVRAQGPDNADRFNTCVIASPSCVVQTILTPVVPPSLNNLEILALPPPLDPLDIDRLDTGNDDDL